MKLKSILTFFVVIFVGSVIHAQISFSPSTTSGCVNDQITFTNTSTAGVHYDWYMGDGNSYSDQPNVNHAYAQGGGYWVQMYAYDATWNYLGYHEEYIEISGPPQDINMPGAACPGDEISLNVYMIDAISWSWDLGDGSTQSGYDYIQHTYTSPGIYYPQVTITSLCGTFVVQDTITITNSLSNFNYYTNLWVDPDSVCPNSNVWGSTYGGFSGYAWDFGDGNTAFGSDYEQWTYSSVGTYTVSLTVTNGCGVDTVLTDQVVVSNTTPVQNPAINMPDTICPNETFWADAYASDGVSYVWNMGDGSPPIMDGSHEYAYSSPGIYTVTCLITNNCGNSTTVNHTIVVDPNAPVNNPYFDVSDHIVCPGDQVNFWSNWEYDFYIDFGDGNGSSESGYHSYSSPGTYVVSSTIQNACGNSITLYDTISVQNNIPVNPGDLYAYAWPSPACPGTEVELDATWGYQTYQWDFGDGSTGTGSEADHIYYAPGVYNVSVLITNGCGNSGTATTTVTIQNNLPITDVDWMVSADTICPGNSVFFQSDEDEGAFTHVWDFGDGNTSTAPIISYQYDNVGVYPVSLTITNGCGYDSTVYDTVVVSNNYSYGPGDLQVFAQNEGCLGDELYFVVIPSGAGDITWDFGDGNSTNQVQTVLAQGIAEVDVAFHAYASIGTYWATYSITNACGNTYTDSIEITVGGPGSNMQLDPTFWWDQSTAACQGQPIEFMAVGGATYVWNFGDGTGNLVTNSSLTPVYHTYTDPGQYTVTVNTYNSCGNSDVTDENIVIPQSQMDITTNTVTQSNCGQNNGVAIATVSGGMAPYTYSWTNGDSGVIADSLSSGVYVITVTDNNDCSNEAIATVSDVEGVTILVDNVVDVNCYGAENGSISVSILGGQPPYNILWSNGDQTEDIYGLQAGPYEIFVTDANGCFAVQSIEVTQPAKSTVSVIAQPATCGSNNGSAVAAVNNGTGPFNFIWPNTSGPSNTTGGLAPGVHTLLVIDGNTCLHEKTFAINETGAPIIVTDSTVVGTCNGTLSSVYISTIGGQQPFTYDWSTGATTQDLTGALPGNYTVEVTGANGCSAYANYVVEETQPSQTSICLVDVDTLTQTNLIVWNPVMDPGIASYNIYKESSQSGLYYLIGNQSADSISQYFDYQSDPSIRSWRYKVAAVDDCGNEAEWSDEHKTIHLTTNMGISGEVNLIWDHYDGFSYPTYYIHRYHPTTGWVILDSLASNLISYTDQTPPSDSSLVYMVSIKPPSTCTASKAQDYNNSRSNTESINMPAGDDSGTEDLSADLTIYPNPSNGIVQVRYEGIITEIRLYDMSGKLIYVNKEFNTIHQVDMSGFERGMYNVQIYTNDGVINGKIIRE